MPAPASAGTDDGEHKIGPENTSGRTSKNSREFYVPSIDDAWTGAAIGVVQTVQGARKATKLVQNVVLKRKLDMSTVVNQARVTQIAKQKFVHLTRPRRPPFPGTPTPPGYVIHNKGIVPNDATGLEKLRDFLLMVLTHRFVGILQLAWVIALVAVFIVFVCCMFYWFGWGEV